MAIRFSVLRDCFSSYTAYKPKLPVVARMSGSEGNYTYFMKLLENTYNLNGVDLLEFALDKLGESHSWNAMLADSNKIDRSGRCRDTKNAPQKVISRDALSILETEIQRQQEMHFSTPKKQGSNKPLVALVGYVFFIGIIGWLSTYAASQEK